MKILITGRHPSSDSAFTECMVDTKVPDCVPSECREAVMKAMVKLAAEMSELCEGDGAWVATEASIMDDDEPHWRQVSFRDPIMQDGVPLD